MSTANFTSLDVSKLTTSVFKANKSGKGMGAFMNFFTREEGNKLLMLPKMVTSTGAKLFEKKEPGDRPSIALKLPLNGAPDFLEDPDSEYPINPDVKAVYEKVTEIHKKLVDLAQANPKRWSMSSTSASGAATLIGTPISIPDNEDDLKKYGRALKVTIPVKELEDGSVVFDKVKLYDENMKPLLDPNGKPYTPYNIDTVITSGSQVKVVFRCMLSKVGKNYWWPFKAHSIFVKKPAKTLELDLNDIKDDDFFSKVDLAPASLALEPAVTKEKEPEPELPPTEPVSEADEEDDLPDDF